MVNNLNEKRPFAGDVQAAPDNVGDLRHLFHRVCLHLVQLATAIVPLEGEQKRTFWSRASSSPFGHNPIVLNIDGKLAIANCNALAEQVLNICKCCLWCHSESPEEVKINFWRKLKMRFSHNFAQCVLRVLNVDVCNIFYPSHSQGDYGINIYLSRHIPPFPSSTRLCDGTCHLTFHTPLLGQPLHNVLHAHCYPNLFYFSFQLGVHEKRFLTHFPLYQAGDFSIQFQSNPIKLTYSNFNNTRIMQPC